MSDTWLGIDSGQQIVVCLKERCVLWQPSHEVQWLGFVVNLEQGCISVPIKKVDALKTNLGAVLDANTLNARRLAGKIIAVGLALSPISRFMTRSMHALLQARSAWCSLQSYQWELGQNWSSGQNRCMIFPTNLA